MEKFRKLGRDAMKKVTGGDDGNGCCAHNADWSVSDCGYTHDEAVAAATYYAQNNPGQHGYWCCTGCSA